MNINDFETQMNAAIASGNPEEIKALLKKGNANLDTMLSPAPEMPDLLSKPITADMLK